MKILLTAFDPFGGESINPAEEAVKLVNAPEGIELCKLTVPTVFGISAKAVTDQMMLFQPDAVIMIGQAGGRRGITPERVAINVDDAGIADNHGNMPKNQTICENCPAAYFSTLPIHKIVEKLDKEGIPSSISNSAGTFVCNHLMYSVLNYAAEHFPKTKAGFVHVPYLPLQASEKGERVPSMPIESIVRGIEIILGTVAEE